MRYLLAAGLFLFSATCFAAEPKPAAEETKPERIPLWQGHAPIGDGKLEEADAWITVHRPAKSNGTAIVICPGGGYGGLVTGAEGHGIAEWLNRHEITGVVLEYRLPAGRAFVPLLDAQRALRTVRSRANDWQLDPSQIGIMGFSAGGHLASTAGTHFDDGDPNAADPVDRVSCRPDFMILVYPVIVMGEKTHSGSKKNLLGGAASPELVALFSNEKQVTDRTPPAFLAHALDDKPVPPENSKAFYEALLAHKVPAQYLELPSGGHGLNGYKGPMWDAWQEKSLAWLAELQAERGARAAAEKAHEDAEVQKKFAVWKESLPAKQQAWETLLEQNLGSFYLPLYQRDKLAGRPTAWDYVEDDPKLPRVLLIGDSVSRGYTLAARAALVGEANVHRAPENCGPTANGLKKLDIWLGDGKWDVIHFNFGIHDRSVPAVEYGQRLDGVVRRLKSTGARLIWASTTPIPPDTKDGPGAAKAIVEKNLIAAEIMHRQGVAIDDLFAFISPQLAKVQNPQDVHFNAEGYELLGKQVAAAIEAALQKP